MAFFGGSFGSAGRTGHGDSVIVLAAGELRDGRYGWGGAVAFWVLWGAVGGAVEFSEGLLDWRGLWRLVFWDR